MGLFYRTIRMVDNGIKPAYVFDGKPPSLKSGVVRSSPPCICLEMLMVVDDVQLAKRFAGREDAKDAGEEAKETGSPAYSIPFRT